MFNRTYSTQPKEDILGGLLLAASICWTVAALSFLPANAHSDNLAGLHQATPISVAQAEPFDQVIESRVAASSHQL